MQLPRVVIAAVFIVIGALIAIPALFDGDGSASPASSTTSASPSPSGGSPSASASPTRSGTGSASPSAPGRPVTASIGAVSCPDRTVNVRIRNTGTKNEDYSIEKNDDTAAIPGTIGPGATRTVAVKLREDRGTRVTVRWANRQIESDTLRANCKKAGAAPSETPPNELPNTGPDAVLWARAATGGAIILTGAIIFWYGGIWPRRREKIFAGKDS
ncbi:hypothetical protein [Actinomadura madurae]|uniref:hypothetical protein n=1 Tax=Actinomadura madurae TaxID=1993 RepID=UPI002026F117|nr:hypothetical protein [Actinomadura madurae]MCP9953657.1 hypothetical protein [Actinomadura madurae]MCP9970413.1 hypothetical protein [Actinomadura madurae]MCP9982895.1 hypothetical protein [Actinomadura madurae]MCQ0005557.1 hypothetical protein [Actinomadura madurae]MCQ0019128.1 hypothetical protein [Actinomadura madurae]